MVQRKEMTALVVDDSNLNRQILIEFLKTKNFKIFEAADGKEALEQVELNNPDIVLLDLIMPIMDGFETMDHLKKKGNNIPIIVITAYIKENTYARCKDLGAKAFINKPVKMQELYSEISKLLEN
jgi:CheY-like chemotaxis protein